MAETTAAPEASSSVEHAEENINAGYVAGEAPSEEAAQSDQAEILGLDKMEGVKRNFDSEGNELGPNQIEIYDPNLGIYSIVDISPDGLAKSDRNFKRVMTIGGILVAFLVGLTIGGSIALYLTQDPPSATYSWKISNDLTYTQKHFEWKFETNFFAAMDRTLNKVTVEFKNNKKKLRILKHFRETNKEPYSITDCYYLAESDSIVDWFEFDSGEWESMANGRSREVTYSSTFVEATNHFLVEPEAENLEKLCPNSANVYKMTFSPTSSDETNSIVMDFKYAYETQTSGNCNGFQQNCVITAKFNTIRLWE